MKSSNASNRMTGAGIAVLRVTVGAVFVAHGLQKFLSMGIGGVAGFMADLGIPFPLLSAIVLSVTELVGGAALIVGLGTRWAALPLAFAMLVAVVTVHLPAGFFLPEGFEYALTLLVANVTLALAGGGAFALENRLHAGTRVAGGPRPMDRAA